MLELHVVGVDAEARALLLSDRTDGRGGRFWVQLDDEFVAVVDQAIVAAAQPRPSARRSSGPGASPMPYPGLPDPPAPAESWHGEDRPGRGLPTAHPAARPGAGPASSLSPREIQARLRQGRTLKEVAEEAGVGVEWIDRFSGPVLAELRAAVEWAGALRLSTPRKGESALNLAEAVRRNLLRRGVRLTDAEIASRWSASHQDGGQWAVRFDYVSRQRPFRAEWLVDLHSRTLRAVNPLAAQLGFAEDASTAPEWVTPEPAPTRTVPAGARGRPAARAAPAKADPEAGGGRVAATTRVPPGARATLPAGGAGKAAKRVAAPAPGKDTGVTGDPPPPRRTRRAPGAAPDAPTSPKPPKSAPPSRRRR